MLLFKKFQGESTLRSLACDRPLTWWFLFLKKRKHLFKYFPKRGFNMPFLPNDEK